MLFKFLSKKYQNRLFEIIFRKVLKSEASQGYKYFSNSSEILKWGEIYLNYFSTLLMKKNNLLATEIEYHTISSYEYYVGWGSVHINNYLRGLPTAPKTEYLDKHIANLDSEFRKFEIEENILAIRRIANWHIKKQIKPRKIYKDKGYLSTSLNINYRLDENGDPQLLKNEAILIIKVPKGTNGIYIESKNISESDEFELLLPRDSELFIERIIRIGSNKIIISHFIRNTK